MMQSRVPRKMNKIESKPASKNAPNFSNPLKKSPFEKISKLYRFFQEQSMGDNEYSSMQRA
jgi:hypothetical protein